MLRVLSTLVLLSFVAGALGDVVSEVRCHEIAFSHAAENRDVEAFVALLDDDARFVGRKVMRGPAEIRSAWQTFFAEDGPTIKWRPRFVEVLKDGDLALTRGPYQMIEKDPEGNRIERWGTFNSVWRRHADGTWRVVFDAGSPAAEAPDPETRALLDTEDDC